MTCPCVYIWIWTVINHCLPQLKCANKLTPEMLLPVAATKHGNIVAQSVPKAEAAAAAAAARNAFACQNGIAYFRFCSTRKAKVLKMHFSLFASAFARHSDELQKSICWPSSLVELTHSPTCLQNKGLTSRMTDVWNPRGHIHNIHIYARMATAYFQLEAAPARGTASADVEH